MQKEHTCLGPCMSRCCEVRNHHRSIYWLKSTGSSTPSYHCESHIHTYTRQSECYDILSSFHNVVHSYFLKAKHVYIWRNLKKKINIHDIRSVALGSSGSVLLSAGRMHHAWPGRCPRAYESSRCPPDRLVATMWSMPSLQILSSQRMESCEHFEGFLCARSSAGEIFIFIFFYS